MNHNSSVQPLLAYLVVDRTGLIEGRINIIQNQLDALRTTLHHNKVAPIRIRLKVVEAFAATVGMIEPTLSHRLQLSGRSPGCDLKGATREILNNLQKALDVGQSSKIEVIILLAGKPAGDWQGGIDSLANRGVRVSVIAFDTEQMIDNETLKKIKTQDGVIFRETRVDHDSIEQIFEWIAESLQHSATSTDRVPPAEAQAISPSPLNTQTTPQSTPVPQPLPTQSQTAPPPQQDLTALKTITLDQSSQVELPPTPEAPATPISPETPVIAEVAAFPAEQVEPPPMDVAGMSSEEVKLEVAIPEQGASRIVQESVSPPSGDLSLNEEHTLFKVKPPETFPSIETVLEMDIENPSLKEEIAETTIEAAPAPLRATKGGVATIWEDREPIDPSDPVPHTDTQILNAIDNWRIIGASRRGKMHAHKGIYREDAFALDQINGWHLMVVADGGGSCPLSRVGSQLAANAAITAMAQIIESMAGATLPLKKIGKIVLDEGVEQGWKALKTEAEQRQVPLGHLGTTFLAVVHRPTEQGSVIGVAQVGDGLVVAEFTDGSIKSLAEPDVGETAGVTLFLTSKPWQEWLHRINVETLATSPQLLAAMCDGVADDFIPFEQHLPQLFDRLKHVIKQEQPQQKLLELLGYDKRGSFDDRTLALIYRSKAESNPTAPEEAKPVIEPWTGEQTDEKHANDTE